MSSATQVLRLVTRLNVGGIVVSPEAPRSTPAGTLVYPDAGKRIIVSLTRETLYAYDGDRLALQTYVTTGNPNLPTPPGHYSVMEKLSPFQFVSPWPSGSTRRVNTSVAMPRSLKARQVSRTQTLRPPLAL